MKCTLKRFGLPRNPWLHIFLVLVLACELIFVCYNSGAHIQQAYAATYRSETGTQNNGASTMTMNVPSGTQDNDVMVAIIELYDTNVATVGITTPSGWTLIQSVTATDYATSIYYRVASSEPSNYTWHFTGTNSNSYATGATVSYTGINTSSPVDAHSGAQTTCTTSCTAPTVTTTVANDTVVALYSSSLNAGVIWTPPSGFSQRVNLSNSGYGAIEMSDILWPTPGATGTETATDTSSFTGHGGTFLLALKPGSPSVTTNAASSVTSSTATLNGNVNPDGVSTTAWFRYGTSNVACSSLTTATGGQSEGSGISGIDYTQALTGLSSNTTYYYCALASNAVGTTYGAVTSFTTPVPTPTTTTNSATNVNVNMATFNGTANPNGSSSTGYFVYGTSNVSCGSMASSTSGSSTSLGSGSSGVGYSYDISGLTDGTTYYFCAAANNAGGTTYGTVQSFTTTNSCNPPASGNLTLTHSCSFANIVDGVDNGTGTTNTAVLTVPNGVTLTVGNYSNQVVAFGSIVINSGGSIIINKGVGAALKKGPLWVADADTDGYPTTANPSYVFQMTQPSGYSRRGQMTTLATADCNDSNANVYQNITNLVTDADEDGYPTNTSGGTECVGVSTTVSGRTYYKNISGSYTWLPLASALSYNATNTYSYTGSQQTFSVPSDISTITATAYGAAGDTNSSSAAGKGGEQKGDVTVTGGSTLYVYVGGAGSSNTGGYNGGADGSTTGHSPNGGGGGGASDVRTTACSTWSGNACTDSTSLGTRFIIAGGGGGAGGGSSIDTGGTGGGSTGGTGANGTSGAGGGTGGTQSAGGTSGSGGSSNGTSGSGGSLGTGGGGGAGGSGFFLQGTSGAGGGGGYYGGAGGGGGGGINTSGSQRYGAGGGGGSNYINGSSTINSSNIQSSNGQVIIDYTENTDCNDASNVVYPGDGC